MTPSPPARSYLKELKAHLPSLGLICASFAYIPPISFFAECWIVPKGDFLFWLLYLGGVGLLWFILLVVMVLAAGYHAALRDACEKDAQEGRGTPPSEAQRRYFRDSHAVACINLSGGPFLAWMICRCCSEPDNVAGCLVVTTAVMAISWLPASITWLRVTAGDVGLMRKVRLARFAL